MTIKVLVLEHISDNGISKLKNAGFQVDVKLELSKNDICSIIGQYDCVIIRSKTNIDSEVINAGKNLRVIGRAGVGVDNIDIAYATAMGILIMNTPIANVISAAEHSCAMILSIARNIPFAHESMHRGEWKRSEYTGIELDGKILGIIGIGHVGMEVSKRMKAFNMTIIGYDPFISKDIVDDVGIKLTTFNEVISSSDFITIHTPLLPNTKNMISISQFRMMKPNVRIINVARGGIINEEDLYTALKEKIIAGAAFDVWCNEPLIDKEKNLLELGNLVTTPHLGASTIEAQERVSTEIADHLVMFLKDNIISNVVNTDVDVNVRKFRSIVYMMGILMRYISENYPLEKLEIDYCGLSTIKRIERLTVAILAAYFGDASISISTSNIVSIAKSNGIEIIEREDNRLSDHINAMNIKFKSRDHMCGEIRGAIVNGQPMLVGINSSSFNIPLNGIICLYHKDETDAIRTIESILEKAGVDVLQIPIDGFSTHEIMLLAIDKGIPTDVIPKILGMVGIRDIKIINFIG